MKLILPFGPGLRLYRHRFRLRRWRGPGDGIRHEGDGNRWRRVWMLEWPFGLIHVLGRWDQR